MVLFALNRTGFERVRSQLKAGGPALWVNKGVLTAAEMAQLRNDGVDLTDFTSEVGLDRESVEEALETIALHHPGLSIYVEPDLK